MAVTHDDLNKLKRAIATGARRVKYSDREVEYRDLDEMKQALEFLQRELGLRKPGSTRVYVQTSKGLTGA